MGSMIENIGDFDGDGEITGKRLRHHVGIFAN